jgi:non-ribosomal peptide synthetase component F
MIGLFINTLPMRVAVPDEAELAPWLRQFQGGQADLRRFEATPLVQIQGWSEIPRGQSMFESLFIFENFPVDATLASRAGRLGVEAVRFLDQTNYPLNIMAVPGAQLFIKVSYDPRRFDADAIERLLGHLRTLLEGMAADPARRLADLPVLSELEQRQLLEHWNAPDLNHSPHPEHNDDAAIPDLDGLAAEDLDAWIEHLQRSLGETGDEPYAR